MDTIREMTPAEKLAKQIADLQKKREVRKAAGTEAREKQYAIDLARLDALEEEHGFERVLSIKLEGWDARIGGPTLVVARVPRASEAVMKAFESDINKSKEGSPQRLTAQSTLARACLVYPDPVKEKDDFNAVLETASGVLANVALQVVRRAQGVAESEGKD